MKKYLVLFATSIICLTALAQTSFAASSHNIKIGLNHAYPKADGTYAVVVKDVPGVHLALYVNDNTPVYATVNKKDWATFRGVKLPTSTGKISFGRIFKTKGKSYQKPLRYVRYFNAAEGSTVAFLVANPTKPVEPTTATPPTPTVSKPVTTTVKPVIKPVSVPAPKPKAVPKPAPAPSTSCRPLTNGGNCYKAGEYCRDSDHGATGIAGNGEAIICADNNGWRWEPR